MLLHARSISFSRPGFRKSIVNHYSSWFRGFCRTASHPASRSDIAALPAQLSCGSCAQRTRRTTSAAAAMAEMHESSLPGLLATCALMFGGAYGCGMLPSWLPLSEQRLASVNAFGAGLLLSSALVIILPEGFEAAMETHEGPGLPEWSISLALLAGFWFMLLLDTLSHLLPSADASSGSSTNNTALQRLQSCRAAGGLEIQADADHHANDEECVVLLSDVQHGSTTASSGQYSSQPGTPKATQRITAAVPEPSSTGGTGNASSMSPAKKGVAKAGGSVRSVTSAAMRSEVDTATAAVGRLGSGGSSSSQLQQPGGSIAAKGATTKAANAAEDLHYYSAAAAGGGVFAAGRIQGFASWFREPAQQALLGLMVHAASDGIAVGAASLATEPAVSLSVAMAMVVHKGPVAIGLSTYLQNAKWSVDRVHKGLLLFSAASPAAALLTYFVLSGLPFLSAEDNIPLAILFSGGTVLYAATVHILPGALGRGERLHHHQGSSQSYSAGGLAARPALKTMRSSSGKAAVQQTAQSKWQLLLVSVGMLLPWVLSAVFHHEHSH